MRLSSSVMNARLASRIETGVELLASALLSGAVAHAALALLQDGLPHPQAALLAAAIGAGTFLLTSLAFRRKAATPTFRTPAFPLPELEISKPEELLLGDEDRLAPDELVLGEADRLEPEPLELDDVLAQLEPDSRVVQLFDRKAMPTPGQLQSRIEDHLGHRAPATQHDASQALSEALAELRRSLR